jgi:hypothetical protein
MLEVLNGANVCVLGYDTELRINVRFRGNSEQLVTPYSTMKTEAVYHSETLVITCNVTRCDTQ